MSSRIRKAAYLDTSDFRKSLLNTPFRYPANVIAIAAIRIVADTRANEVTMLIRTLLSSC